MDFAEFVEFHRPTLATDEVRHNVLLSILIRGLNDTTCKIRFWSLGGPGNCAVQQAGYGIVLGDVGKVEAAALASDVRNDDFPSVMGPDLTSAWFVETAKTHGIEFPIMLPQTIHVLDQRPVFGAVSGRARFANMQDIDLVQAWLDAFVREAVPYDKPPTYNEVEERIKKKRVFLWSVDERPVAMSCVGRTVDKSVAIAPVFTPPSDRCRGYAGAVTAAVVSQILDQGYRFACLYTDDHNPASNRCYANVGFRPHCQSRHYRRDQSPASKSRN